MTAFLGLARAARVSATALLPAFAMVLALSLVSFAGMVRGAVVRGEVTQSWQQSAPRRYHRLHWISAVRQRDIASAAGRQPVPADLGDTRGARVSGLGMTVMVADPASTRRC